MTTNSDRCDKTPPAREPEPACSHSHLPGGLGCITCQVRAFEAYRARIRVRAQVARMTVNDSANSDDVWPA